MTAVHRTLTRPLPPARQPGRDALAILPREEEGWRGELVPNPAAARTALARGNEEAAVQLALRPVAAGAMSGELETAAPPAGAFRPMAVESPGGGRIRDKRDPASGDTVNVGGVNGPIPLRRVAAQAWSAMVSAARAAGIAGPLLLPVSGYRSSARQQRLWDRALARYGTREEARKWVAPPGGSPHQSGRAIDLYLGTRNDSTNVAKLRRTPAYQWLVANAQRFGFYPYEREPWHWEYNPPAAGPVAAGAMSGELETARVRAGRLEVPAVPVLAGHRGQAPALVLRWNDMASVPAEIDVVVHLHGYSRPGMRLPRDIEPYSGLDLVPVDGAGARGRAHPTLTVLPRAHFTGVQQRGGNLYVYTFPALDGSDGRKDGLTRLIRFSLNRFAAAGGGPAPRVGRLILTAHSGGGASLLRILRFRDPHEVHVYDALYWHPGPLADWARRHLRRDQAALAAAGSARSGAVADAGALRVFYRRGTRPYSRQLQRAIAADLKPGLNDRYRVEASSFGHWEIPRNYGWRILADAAADVPRAVRELPGGPEPNRTRPQQRPGLPGRSG